MQEDFLHYLWKLKKINFHHLKTTQGESIIVDSVGQHNHNSGPDFFNAKIKIGEQLWAGNVEIHIKSSDWFLHNHEQDENYDNVILHVVWNHDTDVFRSDNSKIPTLSLKPHVSQSALANYNNLYSKSNRWINCENEFAQVDDFLVQNWLERLYFERLERKASEINDLLVSSKNNWEAVLFKMLAKNFGLKVNGDAFLSITKSFDFSLVRKLQSNPLRLEALFFGQAGMLEEEVQEWYFSELKKEYFFLKNKYQLSNKLVLPVNYFRLRPNNFPTIRLSQLASLFAKEQNLFSKIIEARSIKSLYEIFKVETSDFWENHFTFNKASKVSKKKLTKPFVDLLLVNTIMPLKFTYARSQGKQIDDEIMNIMKGIASEKNSIVEKFNTLKKVSTSALQSQSILQLKNEYCQKNKCLKCAIGNALISRNN